MLRRLVVPLAVGALAAATTFGAITIVEGNDDAPSSSMVASTQTTLTSAYQEGRVIFARMGCGSCHRLAAAGSTGTIGPNLDDRLANHTAASLAERILRRPTNRSTFTVMPDNFGERMSNTELDSLITFLLATS